MSEKSSKRKSPESKKPPRQIVFNLPPGEAVRRAEEKAARARARAELIRKRAQRAVEGLARWEKRLRLAKRKIMSYQRTVNYYRKQGVFP